MSRSSDDPITDKMAISALLAVIDSPPSASEHYIENVRNEADHVAPAALSNPADLDITALTEAFQSAALSSPRETRLLLSCSSCTEFQGSAVRPLEREIGSWGLVGVLQRTQDVHFNISLPIHNNEHPEPYTHVRFNIFYDPGRDSCVLENLSKADIFLDYLSTETTRTRVGNLLTATLESGLWRLSMEDEQHVLDMLILRRHFTVTTYRDPTHSAPEKRKTRDESIHEMTSKRSRQENNESTEIRLLPRMPLSLRPKPDRGMAQPSTAAKSQEGTPLLDLKDRDTLLILGDLRPTEDFHPSFRYKISHLENIASTNYSKIFAARHTHYQGVVVAKVMNYTGGRPEDLISHATKWSQEVNILRKLQHKNIVSLISGDGRLLALYFERLPESLKQGRQSPFTATDAHTILRDMSSALEYLDRKQVFHNDIKPANIAYSAKRGAVLIEFGLATCHDQEPSNTGTVWYIPPEYIRKEQPWNKCGDVWALGVTMLYVLGRLDLPEMLLPAWEPQDVFNQGSRAQQRMVNWLDMVADTRKRLNTTDMLEHLVYQMLNRDSAWRIRAVRMVSAFEVAGGKE